jgi:hypothetical protein
MATTLEILLIDTVHLIQALGEDDFDEARFRCEAIVRRAWADQMSKVGNAAMNLEAFLRPSAIRLQAGRDEALAELIAQVENTASPLRGSLPPA